MYKTEDDIFNQHVSLRQTSAFMQGKSEQIKDFFGISGFYSVTFTGCGMMYALCKSAELSLKLRGGLNSLSCAAGDLAMNMPYYSAMLDGTLMIVSSRSGNTSEVIMAVDKARRGAGAQTIAVTVMPNSKLSGTAELCVELPWAADSGMLPTKSLSNVFLANLYMVALLSGSNALLDEIRDAAGNQERFIETVSAELEGIGQSGTWDRAIILADGELAGVAEAGALTLTRMCGINASYSNILNFRHGAFNTVDERTLVIMAVSPLDDVYQSVMLRELRYQKAQLVTITSREENIFGSDLNVVLPPYESFAARGLPLLFALQAIAYYKTLSDGKNPDKPEGVHTWIRL